MSLWNICKRAVTVTAGAVILVAILGALVERNTTPHTANHQRSENE